MICSVLITEEYRWRKVSKNGVSIYYKGEFDDDSLGVLFNLPFANSNHAKKYIDSLNINFSVIILTENCCIMAVDKIRSTPIIYTKSHNKWFVDCKLSRLIGAVGEKKIDRNSALSIAMSGYTIGDSTIYETVYSLVAGQIVFLRGHDNIKKIQYYHYLPKTDVVNNNSNYANELKNVTIGILKKTIKSLNGRQAIIPLSAGNDSRLIASGFRYLGYDNVKCYSYGFEDFESQTSRVIAKKLGYEWRLIKLSTSNEKAFYKSDEFKDYLNYSDVGVSIPVVRWLSTVRILKKSKWIDNNAVFINGNSGDFISGGHINKTLYCSAIERKLHMRHVLKLFTEKHFRLWGRLQNKKNYGVINKLLLSEYNKLLEYDNEISIESLYESLEYSHRQTKYVVSAQRVYEYYGYEWRLPLWDVDYLDFWANVPLNFKYKQRLYTDVLLKENWSDVWKVPVNKSNIRPMWIVPLRVIAKFVFLIFGNSKIQWRKFELSVFKYWMDNGRVTMLFPYSKFLLNRDIKGVQSLISKSYLNGKKYFF